MTAQIGDIYRFKKNRYTIIAMSKPINFHPSHYGFKPTAPHTACWRGYCCEYIIKQDGLYLDKLEINCADGHYPALFGICADESPEIRGSMKVYRNLNHRINFTGNLVVGSGFIDAYYIHMGFQQAWAYKKVLEFLFDHEQQVTVKDHSELVKKIRDQIQKEPACMKQLLGESLEYIAKSFSLDMADKCRWLTEP